MPKNMKSSYKKNNYENIFRQICLQTEPNSILEIGILDGYSLQAFVNHSKKDTKIVAIDLFEDYEYKIQILVCEKLIYSLQKYI